jgi:pSer/pThr/pTyr-binding forkhead associated (FHA) protein
MRRDGEAILQPGQAALIVTYGNTTRKYRPLDRDLFLLGRSPLCDVALVSPEAAPVHCILQRTADGWRIRDCSGGRHATRLNGRAITEEALNDADVLQIGAFSFELRLPAANSTPTPGTTPAVNEIALPRLKQLQRSRRNLVRLALRWRERAQKSKPLPPSLAELELQAETLRGLQRDYQKLVQEYEERLSEVEKAEREVCDERTAFERECVERRVGLERQERDLERRREELARAPVAQAVPETKEASNLERGLELDRRSRELNHFARYLQRCRRQAEDKSVYVVSPSEAEHWRRQCEQLQANWSILEAQFQQELAEAKIECDRAREQAEALAVAEKETQAVVDALQHEIHNRDLQLQKMRLQLDHRQSESNQEHSGCYEQELNAFRQELERDRQELNEQLRELQARQNDIEAASREAELQMSRERAAIAHERAELTRLRDEIRLSRERGSRASGIRERLAHLRSLRQELSGTSASAPGNQRREEADIKEENPVRGSVD